MGQGQVVGGPTRGSEPLNTIEPVHGASLRRARRELASARTRRRT